MSPKTQTFLTQFNIELFVQYRIEHPNKLHVIIAVHVTCYKQTLVLNNIVPGINAGLGYSAYKHPSQISPYIDISL